MTSPESIDPNVNGLGHVSEVCGRTTLNVRRARAGTLDATAFTRKYGGRGSALRRPSEHCPALGSAAGDLGVSGQTQRRPTLRPQGF